MHTPSGVSTGVNGNLCFFATFSQLDAHFDFLVFENENFASPFAFGEREKFL